MKHIYIVTEYVGFDLIGIRACYEYRHAAAIYQAIVEEQSLQVWSEEDLQTEPSTTLHLAGDEFHAVIMSYVELEDHDLVQ